MSDVQSRETPAGVEAMRAICDSACFRASETADGEQLRIDVWWPNRPLPQVVLTSSRHIAWGASLEPEEARKFADEVRRAADDCDRARAALTETTCPNCGAKADLCPSGELTEHREDESDLTSARCPASGLSLEQAQAALDRELARFSAHA